MKRVYRKDKIDAYWLDVSTLGFTNKEQKIPFDSVLEKMDFVGFDTKLAIESMEDIFNNLEGVSSRVSLIFITGPFVDKELLQRAFLEYHSVGGRRWQEIIYQEYPKEVNITQDLIAFTYNKRPKTTF